MEDIDRILRAKIQLQRKKPFFGYLLLRLRHIEDRTIDTACINIHGEMRYNPDWINSMTDDQIEGVLEHEIFHPIFEHLKRRMTYIVKNKELALHIWQICEDLVVNDILVTNNQPLPEGVIPNPDHTYTLENFGIEIVDINKKTVEEIYEEIASQLPKGGGGDGSGDGDGQPGDDGSSEGSGKQGKNKQSNSDGKNKKSKGRLTLQDQLPKGWDEHERDGDASEEDEEKELKKWRQAFIEAVSVARDHGNVPLGIERRCEELFKEKINWRGILQRFISQMVPFDYTFSLPAKKSYALGVYIPSTESEKIEIIVSIDTSGSIDDNTLTEFLSEMCGIARQFHSVDMLVIVCDADIQGEPFDLKNTSPQQIVDYVNLKGRGGTDHRPVFNWISDNHPQARLLIAFTDGNTTFPKEYNVTIQTLWVLGGNHINEDRIPFGIAITIPKYEK